jgi:hypothetical protein
MVENPFPGMNPYLEQRWGDVHASLITYARDMIQETLPPELRARMQERVFIEADANERAYYPDVHVYQRPGTQGAEGSGQASAMLTAKPLLIRVPPVEITESFIEIIDSRSGGRVVTIIEFVSRSNKAPGKGRKRYRQKRIQAKRAKVNFVEVDLLRGGKPVTLADPEFISPQDRAPYHASVWRAADPDAIEYYGFPLRQPLPAIAIPLRRHDSDVPLNVQALIDLCYTRGRYDDIDYALPLEPPLPSEDQQWVSELLKKPVG